MTDKLASPRGTQDILPPESALWVQVESMIRRIARQFAFEEIRTPIFEHSDLFRRGVGEETDIVSKEMYTFEDRGGRSLTLRPEGTAAVARAYLQHNLANRGLPQKLFYAGPMFRYERPQAGRYRQHHQFGYEILGTAQPEADVETIAVAEAVFRALGIRRFKVLLNSIGCPVCRPPFLRLLQEELSPHLSQLCPDCQRRFDRNPMRMLDCKNSACQPWLDEAPHPAGHLCAECQTHFQSVLENIALLGFSCMLEPRLVRGLDYYTRTVFEITSDELGAQNSLCGGGRYDSLIGLLGGSATPGVGFAGGMERALFVLREKQVQKPTIPALDAYIVRLGNEAQRRGLQLAMQLRNWGLAVDCSYEPRSLSSQLKAANRKKARFALILGEEEIRQNIVLLKDMALEQQVQVPTAGLFAYFQHLGYDLHDPAVFGDVRA